MSLDRIREGLSHGKVNIRLHNLHLTDYGRSNNLILQFFDRVRRTTRPGIPLAAAPSLSKMVYDWDGKRDICYKMYIEDKKALEEIMEYMKAFHQFAPR